MTSEPSSVPMLARLAAGENVEVVREAVALGRAGGRCVQIERPSDPQSLLQDWCNRADPCALIPYWAEIWPASRAIARKLASGADLKGAAVIDLGCGLGLAGIAAGLRGGRVTFVDNHPDALAFARRNAALAGLRSVSIVRADWSEPSWARPFDLVLGADVLYDRSEHEAIAEILHRLLQSGGRAWLGDPNREMARSFLQDWRRSANHLRSFSLPATPGEDAAVTVHQLWLRRA